MGTGENQSFWAPSGVTVRLPPRMRLAPKERERLWKGLERFINSEDSLDDYNALRLAFPDFWPVEIWHYPNQEETIGDQQKRLPEKFRAPSSSTLAILPRIPVAASPAFPSKRIVRHFSLEEEEAMAETERERIHAMLSLAWNPVCHKLFLFYRDTLRDVWRGEKTLRSVDDRSILADMNPSHGAVWFGGSPHEFLLGLTDDNEKARTRTFSYFSWPVALDFAWQEIIDQFPTAAVQGRVQIGMLWEMGDFSLVPHNDFQRAFYLLFRQHWRARVCPRCKMFFIARKPKQIFCGTGCSAGNRLASKRNWWSRVGAKRRAKQRQQVSKKALRGRK